MELSSTLFQRGVSRLVPAPANRPWDLFNAAVERDAVVDAVAPPVPLGDEFGAGAGRLTDGPAPYAQGPDGTWYDGDDFDVADAVGRRLIGHKNDRPYAESQSPYAFRAFSPGAPPPQAPPCALEVFEPVVTQLNVRASGTYAEVGVVGGRQVSYLAVPHDDLGQAGPFRYWHEETIGPAYDADSGGASNEGYSLAWTLLCTESTSYVDVYRTRQGGGAFYDTTYYYLGRFAVSDAQVPLVYAGRPVALVTDDKNWIDPIDGGLDPDTYAGDPVGPAFDEGHNTWAYHGSSRPPKTPQNAAEVAAAVALRDVIYHPHGRTVLNHAGVLVSGNVSFPTKPAAILRTGRKETDPATYKKFALQLEYATPDGPVYGPVTYHAEMPYANVVNHGEAALLVYVQDADPGPYHLFERLSPDGDGAYRSAFPDVTTRAVSGIAYAKPSYAWIYYDQEGPQSTTEPYAETAYVDEPETALLSSPGRPLEMTYAGVSVPDGSAVKALSAARLAEAEGLRGYDFYLFTGGSSYVVSRTGSDLSIDVLVAGVGVRSAADGSALLCTTPLGCAFVGTDGTLRLVSGRQAVDLVEEVPGLFSDVRSLVYVHEDESIAVATDTGLWLYDTEMQGWAVHVDAAPDGVQYDRAGRRLLLRSGETFSSWARDAVPPARDAAVTTQPRPGVSDATPLWTEADLDGHGATHAATFVEGSHDVTVPGTGHGLSAGDLVSLVGAGRSRSGAATALTGRVVSASESAGDTTVTLSTKARSSGAGDLVVESPAQVSARVRTSRPGPDPTDTAELAPGRRAHFRLRGQALRFTVSGFVRLRSFTTAIATRLDTD